MNLWWLIVAGVGLVDPRARRSTRRGGRRSARREARVFHAVNGLPDWLYWPLWLPMQLGNLVVGTLVGLAVAWVGRRLVGRRRRRGRDVLQARSPRSSSGARWPTTSPSASDPGTSQVDAILRGADVPSSGASFPSGHVILVAAIAAVVAPALPVDWWWVPVAARRCS